MKTYTNCPVCEGENFNHFLTCKDNTGSAENFKIVDCISCGFKFTNPIPIETEIGKYYESDDYISHSNTKKGLVNFLYQKVRNYTLDKKVAILERLGRGKNLLDIGCGTGEFLNRANKNNFTVQGIEPSIAAKKQAIDNFNLTVNDESHLNNLKDESFDFITMWHVLEHVYHLNERVETLKCLIKKDGHIIIAVPNHTSLDAKIYKEHWAAFDVPRHLYHFSPESIEKLFAKHGIKLVETLPMKFDSFYVSILSEKYKKGKSSLVSSFLTGMKSNLNGDPTKTYSSQIYIFKK